jgi:hypothetical protein
LTQRELGIPDKHSESWEIDMSMHHVQFLGPTLHPIRKWVFGFATLGAYSLLLVFGFFHGFSLWLQIAGWTFLGVLYCVSNIAWFTRKRRRSSIYFPAVGCWVDDQPCDNSKQ